MLARPGMPAHIAAMLPDERASPEQVAIFRRMTPARRWALAQQLYWSAREVRRIFTHARA